MRTGPLALWDPVANYRGLYTVTQGCEYLSVMGWLTDATARGGRIVSAGREGRDDLVVGVWRTVRPKRLIGSLNRDTGFSPWGEIPVQFSDEIPSSPPASVGIVKLVKKRGQNRLALTSSLPSFRGRYRSEIHLHKTGVSLFRWINTLHIRRERGPLHQSPLGIHRSPG